MTSRERLDTKPPLPPNEPDPISSMIRQAGIELLAKRYEKQSGFYDLVPQGLQPYLNTQIKRNYHFYKKELYPDQFEAFREDMARNFLLKTGVFSSLLEREGFIRIRSIPYYRHPRLAVTATAMLTVSGSFVFVGAGGLAPESEGAIAEYLRVRLPEGEHDRRPSNFSRQSGVWFKQLPQERVPLQLTNLSTSPILEMYGKIMDRDTGREDSLQLIENVKKAFTLIDNDTLRMKAA